MPVFTIPSDYTEQTHPSVVPICIADTDAKGNRIHRVWIDHGVIPAVNGLIDIAGRILHDKCRTSEIAEYAVHSLSRTHGENIGSRPSIQVLNRAKHHAVDLRAGGRRARRNFDVELFAATLNSLQDQYDLAKHVEISDILEKLLQQADHLGFEQVQSVLPFMLRDADGKELTAEFGEPRNTITTRFYRSMRKAAKAAGILWEPGQ